jgi:ribonuclease PH
MQAQQDQPKKTSKKSKHPKNTGRRKTSFDSNQVLYTAPIPKKKNQTFFSSSDSGWAVVVEVAEERGGRGGQVG